MRKTGFCSGSSGSHSEASSSRMRKMAFVLRVIGLPFGGLEPKDAEDGLLLRVYDQADQDDDVRGRAAPASAPACRVLHRRGSNRRPGLPTARLRGTNDESPNPPLWGIRAFC